VTSTPTGEASEILYVGSVVLRRANCNGRPLASC
jgi:hypothetical protein